MTFVSLLTHNARSQVARVPVLEDDPPVSPMAAVDSPSAPVLLVLVPGGLTPVVASMSALVLASPTAVVSAADPVLASPVPRPEPLPTAVASNVHAAASATQIQTNPRTA
jgi:hypothetical protein